MKEYQKLKEQILKNKTIKKAYDELGPEFNLIEMIIEKRLKQKLTVLEANLKISIS